MSPTLTTAAALAGALGVTLPALFDFNAPTPAVDPEGRVEADLLHGFRALPPDRRDLAAALVRALRPTS